MYFGGSFSGCDGRAGREVMGGVKRGGGNEIFLCEIGMGIMVVVV